MLPVDGITEKVMAAKHSGISRLILSEGNRGHFEELPSPLAANLQVHFVHEFSQIYQIAFQQDSPQTEIESNLRNAKHLPIKTNVRD